jgi:hypothetical protein
MIIDAPSSAIALGITLVVSILVEVAYRKWSVRTFAGILTQTMPGADGAVP